MRAFSRLPIAYLLPRASVGYFRGSCEPTHASVALSFFVARKNAASNPKI